jgi:hypothetical protein
MNAPANFFGNIFRDERSHVAQSSSRPQRKRAQGRAQRSAVRNDRKTPYFTAHFALSFAATDSRAMPRERMRSSKVQRDNTRVSARPLRFSRPVRRNLLAEIREMLTMTP